MPRDTVHVRSMLALRIALRTSRVLCSWHCVCAARFHHERRFFFYISNACIFQMLQFWIRYISKPLISPSALGKYDIFWGNAMSSNQGNNMFIRSETPRARARMTFLLFKSVAFATNRFSLCVFLLVFFFLKWRDRVHFFVSLVPAALAVWV